MIPTIKPTEPRLIPATVAPQPFQAKLDESLIRAGQFYIDDTYTNELIIPICKGIVALNMLPEEDRPERIDLWINSGGGAVASCSQLIHTMQHSEIPIATRAIGMTCSAGVFTLIAGTPGMRYVYDGCMLMSHVYAGADGYKKEQEKIAKRKQEDMLSDWMERHYVRHTKKKLSYVRKHLLFYTDMWLTPEEAIKHGVADHIVI